VQVQSATGEVDGGVVLDGGAPDLVLVRAVAALVEKVVTGLARADVAPVEKAAVELEKVAAGRRRGGEGGRRTTGRRDGEGGRRPRSDTVEIQAVGPLAAETARRSTSAQVTMIFSRERREQATVRTNGRETILLG
jgi:hypothetical protein